VIDEKVCPAGHEIVHVGFDRRLSCPKCTKIRRVMRERQVTNLPAGRHPRETMTRVPNRALRERLVSLTERGEFTISEVASGAGYTDSRGHPDIQRLKRQLGITKSSSRRRDSSGGRILYYADSIDYETAVRLCRAMGIEYPAEVGV
jgi:hypothetical protein